MSKTTDLIKRKLKRYRAVEKADDEKFLRYKSHIEKQNKRQIRKDSRREEMEDGHSPLPSGKKRDDKYYEERNQSSRIKKKLAKRVSFDDDIPF